MSNKPIKHHYVPICYLKNFSNLGTTYTINVEEIKKGYAVRIYNRAPAAICYEKNYYNIDETLFNKDEIFQRAGNDNLAIESEILHNLEQKFGAIIERLLKTHELNRADVIDLSDFIIQLKVRNPYHLNNTIEKYKDEWLEKTSIQIQDIIDDPKFKAIPRKIREETFAKLILEAKKDPLRAKGILLSNLTYRARNIITAENDLIRKSLLDCQWYLLENQSGEIPFITSDNPGYSFAVLEQKIYNTKFNNNFRYYFSITPKYCIMIGDLKMDNFFSLEEEIKSVIFIKVGEKAAPYK